MWFCWSTNNRKELQFLIEWIVKYHSNHCFNYLIPLITKHNQSQTSHHYPSESKTYPSHRVPLCKLLEQYLSQLAQQHPGTKFLKSISSVCIPNYPDKNLPTVFVYFNGDLLKQFVGPAMFGGMKITKDGLWGGGKRFGFN